MYYIYQFCTGGFDSEPIRDDVDLILQKLYKTTGPGDVLIGWSTRYEHYIKAINRAQSEGKRAWLWLPVFSELPDLIPITVAKSYKGQAQKGVSAIPGEDFRFVCPSTAFNIDATYSLYQKYFL